MKKLLALLLVGTIGASILSGCGNNVDKVNDKEKDTEDNKANVEVSDDKMEVEKKFAIEGKDHLIIGFDASFPPYGYQDESGEYVGFDIDLAQEVCNRLEWELVKQPIDWNSKDMELSSGAIDCIWNGFTISKDRTDKYTWTQPYVDNSQVFVVVKDAGITTLADLADKVVAVQADSSALEALNAEESASLRSSFNDLLMVPEYNTAFLNLEAGAVDAIAMDIGVAQYQIASREKEFVILDEVLVSELYGIGFLLGNTQLKDLIETTLLEMVEDGTFDEIATKWKLTDSVILGK